MNNEEIIILEELYSKLYDIYLIDENIKTIPSLLFSLLDVKNNRRFRLITKGAIDKNKFSIMEIETLKANNYIRAFGETEKITITAKGIIFIEEQKSIYNSKSLVDYIDEKYFKDVVSMAEKNYSDREKVVLFSMIISRAFSKDSSVDLRRSQKAKEVWTEITNISMELLKKLGVLEYSDSSEIYRSSRSDEAIINLYRHSDKLNRKTNNIFKPNQNKLQYYLDLVNNDVFNTEKLKDLFNKIFGNKKLNGDDINNILIICKEISHSKDIYIFDLEKHIFSDIKYDRYIKEALLSI